MTQSALALRRKFIRILSGGFLPTDLASLQRWQDAIVTSTLWQDSSFTIPAEDTDVLGGWQDRSGKVNDATQATTALKPTWVASAVNGKPGVLFDGTDDLLTIADDASIDFGTGSFTLAFAVSAINADDDLFEKRIGFANKQNTVSADRWRVGDGAATIELTWTSDTNNNTLMFVRDGTTYTVYRNNVVLDTDTGTAFDVTNANAATLCRVPSSGGFFDGYVMASLSFNDALDANSRLQLHDFLTARHF